MNADAPSFRPRSARQGGDLSVAADSFVPATAATATELSVAAASYVPPVVPSSRLCRFFVSGACRKGLNCPFVHDASSAASDIAIAGQTTAHGTGSNDTHVLEEGIQCKFGPGASIVNLELGKEKSRSVVISGLSSGVTEQTVESRLSRFGALLGVALRHGGNQINYATATFSDLGAAETAAASLHGSAVADWENSNAVVVVGDRPRGETSRSVSSSVSVVVKNMYPSTSGVSVKVQWYAPSRCAWVHFRRQSQAQQAATACQGRSFHGHVLSTKFQVPSYRQTTSFSIWIGNLGDTVKKEQLHSFVQRRAKCHIMSIDLGPLPFTNRTGPTVVQHLLRTHGGPLTTFEVAKAADGPKRKALSKFANVQDAKRACKHFATCTKIRELGGTRLFLQPVYTIKYALPSSVAVAVKDDLDAVLVRHPTLRQSLFANGKMTTIAFQADEKKTVAAAKPTLDEILIGSVVRDTKNGCRAVWSRYVASLRFQVEMHTLLGRDARKTWCDRRRQQLLVFGCSNRREGIVQLLTGHLAEAMVETHAVPISRIEFEFILQSGRSVLDKLTRASSSRKVSVDIKNQSLLVEGSSVDARRAKQCIAKIMCNENEVDPNTVCPVCFCPPGEDAASPEEVVLLECRHEYCHECFETWLTGANMCDFPLTCLAEGCPCRMSLADLTRYLSPDQLSGLLRSALDDHVRKNVSTLKFCLSPTCPGVCELPGGQRQGFCSTCAMHMCVDCDASHPDMLCADYAMASHPPDRIRMKIVDEILTLRCPRCKQAFFDFSGCFALHCSVCPCNFCGWCLADCGTNAHAHVLKCPRKLAGAGNFFGSFEMFEEAQNKKRRESLLAFLGTLGLEERQPILQSIEQDLQDLGLQL